MLLRIAMVFAVSLAAFACTANNTVTTNTYTQHYLSDSKTSDSIKKAIRRGKVIEGMCPLQAIAAAGYPGPIYVKKDPTKWQGHVPPYVIVNAQCENPDASTIELMFTNETQYESGKPEVFRVRVQDGKVVLIDKKNFKE